MSSNLNASAMPHICAATQIVQQLQLQINSYIEQIKLYQRENTQSKHQIVTMSNQYNALQKNYINLQRQFTEMQQVNTRLTDDYKELQGRFNSETEEIKKSYAAVCGQLDLKEKELSDLKKKYEDINPTDICENHTRSSPAPKQRRKVEKYVKILLFNHPKYYYHFDDLLKTFNQIFKEQRLPYQIEAKPLSGSAVRPSKKRKIEHMRYSEVPPLIKPSSNNETINHMQYEQLSSKTAENANANEMNYATLQKETVVNHSGLMFD